MYIGQASNIAQRWHGHRSLLRRLSSTRRYNKRLGHAAKKYGLGALRFHILQLCTIPDLTARETEWIEFFRDYYLGPIANSVGAADNPMRGARHTDEARSKISKAISGRRHSDIHRSRIGDAHRGIPKTPEQRLKLSRAKTGVPIPSLRGDKNHSCRPEARVQRMGDLNPARRPEVRARMSERSGMARRVRDIASGEVWRTMSECAATLGVSVAAVHAAATKKNPTVKGRILEIISR